MIQLALVGCGGIAGAHAQRLQAFKPRMKVMAAVDIIERKSVALPAKQGDNGPIYFNEKNMHT